MEETIAFTTAVKTIWHVIGSCALWFNLISTPFLLIWPEISTNQ